jgi:hypothetical protein
MAQSTFTFKQPTTIEILPVLESDNIRLKSPESSDGIRPPSPESGQLDSGEQYDRNPAIWPAGRIWPERPDPDPASLPGSSLSSQIWPESGRLCRIPTKLPESDHFRQNPAIPDSDKTVRIPAFISNSCYISRNQVKMVRILSVSDRISLSMIFILFYINIYMF